MREFRSNGKLLLFGEYFILEGATGLAIPTQKGQTLTISKQQFPVNGLNWKSLDHEDKLWFEAFFDENLDIKHTTDTEVARTLQTILLYASTKGHLFFEGPAYYEAISKLEFPNNWGLGSSSTLIANIAQWANVDAFDLFFSTFKGSGYDIACALSNQPLVYHLQDKKPVWNEVDFYPPFKDNLFFVHLGKKQNSREEIQRFHDKYRLNINCIDKITWLTEKSINCKNFTDFCNIIDEHESIISEALQLPKVKDLYFRDFDGSIKSLGAWGGDFVMAASHLPFVDIKGYFETKGYSTIVTYNEMIRS